MIQFETPLGRASLLASIALIFIGALGVLVTVTGIIGMAAGARFTWGAANPALITLLVSVILLAGGILLGRRIQP